MMPESERDTYHGDWFPPRRILAGISAFFVLIALVYFFAFSAPIDFPQGSLYTIHSGETISSVSVELKDQQFVRSAFLLKYFTYAFSLGQARIISGDYAFPATESVWTVAWRISHGDFGIHPVRVTIPEGLSSFQIAGILSKSLPYFSTEKFEADVSQENLEGYLFPDTYFLMPNISEQQIIDIMHDTFVNKTATTSVDTVALGKSQSDVIKMASILELEAATSDDRRIVAGILWKRIALGMPLQVDSSFKYIAGKASSELTIEDLSTSSPYNSYNHRGLPPTPISNPGVDSIEDAAHPTATSYLYFLSDKKGNMHYAKTLAEQDANIAKYLR